MFFNSSLLKVFTISHLKCLSISSFKIMDFRFCLWRPVDWNNYAFRALLNFSWTLARNSFLSLLQSNLENVELNNKWGLFIIWENARFFLSSSSIWLGKKLSNLKYFHASLELRIYSWHSKMAWFFNFYLESSFFIMNFPPPPLSGLFLGQARIM